MNCKNNGGFFVVPFDNEKSYLKLNRESYILYPSTYDRTAVRHLSTRLKGVRGLLRGLGGKSKVPPGPLT